MKTDTQHLHLWMFLSDENLSYSAHAFNEQEARAYIRKEYPAIGRLVLVGKQ